MGKHHTEDYKLSAVKYALRTDNQVKKQVIQAKFRGEISGCYEG
jgi:hypothetical protein